MKKVFRNVAVITMAGMIGFFMFGVTGNAYIDPSVSSYLIQAIAGVAIAVGAFVAFYWRRAKKKLQNKLGIDENRNKEVETDEIISDTTDKQ